MNKLTEMEAFTSVIDHGGFTGAARRLGLSKSAVSKHVTALEKRLGVKLLTRTTRRVDPTEIGLLYYDRAHRVLIAAQDADLLVGQATEAAAGSLRVAIMDECSAKMVLPHVPRFLASYPEIALTIESTNGYLEPLSAGYDIFLRSGAQPDGQAHSHILSSVQYVLVASPQYLKKSGDLKRVEDLSSRALLQSLGSNGDSALDLETHAGEKRRIFTPGRLVAKDTDLLTEAALEGLGIAFLPRFTVASHLRTGRLEQVLPGLPSQQFPVHIACTPKHAVTPKVRVFFEFMSDACNREADAPTR